MPKVSLLQEAFSGGEFSPMAQGRVSSEKYKVGLNACLNYVPTLQGPLLRRPGTKFVTTVQNPAQPPVLIPFIFNQSQAYMLEFGQQYIKFYANGGKVLATANLYNLAGAATNDGQHFYFATRNAYVQKTGETIIASSLVSASINSPVQFQVQTPYNWQDVSQIKWAQSADTLYLTHPNYPTFKLQRYGTYDWKMQQVYFQDGPYLALNSYRQSGDSTNITLLPGGYAPLGWTGTAGMSTIVQTGPQELVQNVVSAASGTPGAPCLVTVASTLGYSQGQQVIIRGVSGTTELNTFDLVVNSSSPTSRAITIVNSTQFTVQSVPFTNTYIGSGFVRPSLITTASDVNRVLSLQQGTFNNAGQRVWGVITSYLGLNDTFGFYYDSSNAPFNSSTVLYWNMGCYGGQINFGGVLNPPFAGSTGSSCFPANVCFHQNRLVFSGSPNYPQQIDGSVISQFETFTPNVAQGSTALQVIDSNAYQFTLNSTEVNTLQWMRSTAQGLLAASYSNEWCITPSTQAASISPTNINAQQSSFFGAANIDAVSAGNAVLYVQRAQRKVREMNYFFQLGTFRSTDLTEIAEHISLPSITKLCVQKEPQPLVWAAKSDGNLATMTYNRDDLSINAGWARHVLGGRSDTAGTNPQVISLASIPDPGGTYDQVWMLAKRYLAGGSTAYSIEYLTNFYNDNFLQEDAFQGDCGSTFYNASPITNIVQSSIYTQVYINNPAFFMVNNNGAQLKIVGVTGLNQSFTDVNGNVTNVNAVNEKVFVVGSSNGAQGFFSLMDQSGSYFVNTGSSTPWVAGGSCGFMAQTISGLGYLVGETINVLADGGNHPPVTVVGSGVGASATGVVTLNYPVAKAQFGYAFNSQGQLLRSNSGSAQGNSVGSTRRVNRAAAMLHNAGDWAWGMTFTNLIPVSLFQADIQPADTAIPLFSGIIREGIEAPYDFENMLCFQQNSMLPGMIQAITTFFEESDV